MQDSKVVGCLRKLSTEERTQFYTFVELSFSPSDKRRDRLVALCNYIRQFDPLYEDARMSDDAAYAIIYPDKSYNDTTIRALRNALLEQLYDFLAVKQLLTRPTAKSLYKMEEMIDRKLYEEVPTEINKLGKKLDKEEKRDSNHFTDRFQLAAIQHRFDSARRPDFSGYEVLDALDRAYYMEKISYFCNRLNATNMKKGQERITTMRFNPTFSGKDKLSYNTWGAAKKLLTETDDLTHYRKFKKTVFTHPTIFSINDLHNFCTYLQNSTPLIFQNVHERYLELFELYTFQWQQGIYDSFDFNVNMFCNIAFTALHLDQVEWLEKLIATFKENIDTFEDGFKEVILAAILVAKKDWSAADEQLTNMPKGAAAIANAIAYPIRIKTYYGNGMTAFAIKECNNYRAFLNRLKKKDEKEQHLTENKRKILTQRLAFTHQCKRILDLSPHPLRSEQLKEIEAIEEQFYKDGGDGIMEEFWLQEVLSAALPQQFGEQLSTQRLAIKNKSKVKEEDLSAFQTFLTDNAHSMTSAHLTCHQQFLRPFTMKKKERRQFVCETTPLIDRQFWLKQLSDDILDKRRNA
jgi:hypothetical protein